MYGLDKGRPLTSSHESVHRGSEARGDGPSKGGNEVIEGDWRREEARQEEKETGERRKDTGKRGVKEAALLSESKHATVLVSASGKASLLCDGPHVVSSEREMKIRKRERKQKIRAHKDVNWATCSSMT